VEGARCGHKLGWKMAAIHANVCGAQVVV